MMDARKSSIVKECCWQALGSEERAVSALVSLHRLGEGDTAGSGGPHRCLCLFFA